VHSPLLADNYVINRVHLGFVRRSHLSYKIGISSSY